MMNTTTAKGGGMSDDELKTLQPVNRCLVMVAEALGWHTQLENGTVIWRYENSDVWCSQAPLPEIAEKAKKLACDYAALRDTANEARAQNAKLVSDIYAHEHINTQMIFEKRKLERELKEATKDKKRLDWLDENAGDIEWYGRRGFIATSLDDVRAAIDAARKEQG